MPRKFSWPVRTIVSALKMVAAGTSYTRAANSVREAPNLDGQLIADWVEAFASPLWRDLGPKSCPKYLVCDSKPFFARRKGESRSRKIFDVAMVVGSDGDQKWKPVLAVAIPNLDQAGWVEVLSLIPGRPLVITTDEDNSLMLAVAAVWPLDLRTGEVTPRINYCVHHLKANFKKALPPRLRNPRSEDDKTDARNLDFALRAVGTSAASWAAFRRVAAGMNEPRINSWLWRKNRGSHLTNQFLVAAPDEAHSNSAAEAELLWLGGQWAGRAATFRNRARTNLLLNLMVLHRRGADQSRAWTQTLDKELEAHGGHTNAPVRSICAPKGTLSLWSP